MIKEEEIIKQLGECYNNFLLLSKEHPNEIDDFIDGIHKCQYVLALRLARKHYPKLFPKK